MTKDSLELVYSKGFPRNILLFELPKELEKVIEDAGSKETNIKFEIRGKSAEASVLCCNELDLRYAISRVYTSNSILAVEQQGSDPSRLEMERDSGKAISSIQADIDFICELDVVNSGIESRVIQVFRDICGDGKGNYDEYRGPEYEQLNKNSATKKVRMFDLQHLIPANDAMIKKALRDIPAVYFSKLDSYKILAQSFVVETLELILANCVVNDWDVSSIPLSECVSAIIEESGSVGLENSVEMAAIVGCVLSKFGNRTQSDRYALNGSKILRFYAKKLFESRKDRKWMFYDFLSSWKNSVPPMFMDMIPNHSLVNPNKVYASVLRGLGVVDYENVGFSSTELPTIKYFDKLGLGNSVLERMSAMFSTRRFWSYDEVLEHLEDLAGYSGFEVFFGDGKTLKLGSEINMGNSFTNPHTGEVLEFKVDTKVRNQIDAWISRYAERQQHEGKVVYTSSSHLKYSGRTNI